MPKKIERVPAPGRHLGEDQRIQALNPQPPAGDPLVSSRRTRLFEQDSGPTGKFIVAPRTKDDGPALPDGKHVAMTHWSVGGGGADGQVGVSQYCARPSGEAVQAFVKDYPYSDSPEPSAG